MNFLSDTCESCFYFALKRKTCSLFTIMSHNSAMRHRAIKLSFYSPSCVRSQNLISHSNTHVYYKKGLVKKDNFSTKPEMADI